MTEATGWSEFDRVLHDPDATPLDVLRTVGSYQRYLGAIEKQAVAAARATGATWEEIGHATGVTRQSAWQRFKLVEDLRGSLTAQLRDPTGPVGPMVIAPPPPPDTGT